MSSSNQNSQSKRLRAFHDRFPSEELNTQLFQQPLGQTTSWETVGMFRESGRFPRPYAEPEGPLSHFPAGVLSLEEYDVDRQEQHRQGPSSGQPAPVGLEYCPPRFVPAFLAPGSPAPWDNTDAELYRSLEAMQLLVKRESKQESEEEPPVSQSVLRQKRAILVSWLAQFGRGQMNGQDTAGDVAESPTTLSTTGSSRQLFLETVRRLLRYGDTKFGSFWLPMMADSTGSSPDEASGESSTSSTQPARPTDSIFRQTQKTVKFCNQSDGPRAAGKVGTRGERNRHW
ncbi:hypothetical protein FSARC_9983 [Fusarium sarcochroum]|uniref:Uncharacterized protein n=1 Tax=Fusarium sarcochroum TaxID=1208366 RepID=A0A8H4X4R5_9HYPO|nr:hypothetical protein FSARC_9983 [Fusarium sarcochroum]